MKPFFLVSPLSKNIILDIGSLVLEAIDSKLVVGIVCGV